MATKPLKILAINPGSKYIGIAFFEQSDLQYWGIKVFKGKHSNEKLEKIEQVILDLIDRYGPNILAIKKLHPSRTSKNLNLLAFEIENLSRGKDLKVFQYSLKDLKGFFSPEAKIAKREMAEMIVPHYPFLIYPFLKEKRNKNPYFIRMFEAVALGIRCFDQLDH
jgi:Holliday junction resolvasome RuvABC endonuclease subunit